MKLAELWWHIQARRRVRAWIKELTRQDALIRASGKQRLAK